MSPQRQAGETDTTTRQRVIEAAISCIIEEGFYRATSNHIARRAGVTWGVIQYHFSTREGLLLAVFQHSADQLAETLDEAVITGTSTAERLESLADVIWKIYRRPQFLAYIQILLNLTHDPTTAPDTIATLTKLSQHTTNRLRELFDQTISKDQQLRVPPSHLFTILRGLAISEQITEASTGLTRPAVNGDHDPSRVTLIHALSCLIDSPA
jgi:AcrR family transcriptional regulator